MVTRVTFADLRPVLERALVELEVAAPGLVAEVLVELGDDLLVRFTRRQYVSASLLFEVPAFRVEAWPCSSIDVGLGWALEALERLGVPLEAMLAVRVAGDEEPPSS